MARTQTVQTKMVNGVDTRQLTETVEAVRQQPDLGAFHFRVRNRWVGGTLNRSEIGSFYGAGQEHTERDKPFVLDNDEAPVLLGNDTAPNPVEYVLHALAGCVTTTTVAHAAARGIRIDSIETEIEGDLDVRGFLGLSNSVPRGYQDIRVTMRIESDASPETLRALAEYSPVFNTITHAVPVHVTIEKP